MRFRMHKDFTKDQLDTALKLLFPQSKSYGGYITFISEDGAYEFDLIGDVHVATNNPGSESKSKLITTIAADIASRVPEMAKDCTINNAVLIEGLIKPLTEESK